MQCLAHTRKLDYFLQRQLTKQKTETQGQYNARVELQKMLRDMVQMNREYSGGDTVKRATIERTLADMPRLIREKYLVCAEADHQATIQVLEKQADEARIRGDDPSLEKALESIASHRRTHAQNLRDIRGSTTVAEFWFEKILRLLECDQYVKRKREGAVTREEMNGLTAIILNPPGHFYVYVRVNRDSWLDINWRVGERAISTGDLRDQFPHIHYGI